MANKILKYIDGIPLYINEEEETELFKHLNIDTLGKTTLPTSSTPFPTMPKGFNYDSPLGNRSVFAEDNNYWLGDKLKQAEKINPIEIPKIGEYKITLSPAIGDIANEATVNLFNNLYRRIITVENEEKTPTLFGLQDALVYGREWYLIQDNFHKTPIYKNLRDKEIGAIDFIKSKTPWSDISLTIKKITNKEDYPAVFGWDIAEMIKPHTEYLETKDDDVIINYVQPHILLQCIKWVYDNGGVNTICWHCMNPENEKKFGDVEYSKYGTVKLLLDQKKLFLSNPKIAKDEVKVFKQFQQWLKYVIDFFKDPLIAEIPIIFRPLHEANIYNVFWWDKSCCTDSEYIELWKYIVEAFKAAKVQNVLFAYSINDANYNNINATDEQLKDNFNQDFFTRYPENDNTRLVDIIGYDMYLRDDDNKTKRNFFIRKINQHNIAINNIATQKLKVPCISEIGIDYLSYPNVWEKVYAPLFSATNIAYALIWRNAKANEKDKLTGKPVAHYSIDENTYSKNHIAKSSFSAFLNSCSKSLLKFTNSNPLKNLYKSFFLFLLLSICKNAYTQSRYNDTTGIKFYVKKDSFFCCFKDNFATFSKSKLKFDKTYLCYAVKNYFGIVELVFKLREVANIDSLKSNKNPTGSYYYIDIYFIDRCQKAQLFNYPFTDLSIAKLSYMFLSYSTYHGSFSSRGLADYTISEFIKNNPVKFKYLAIEDNIYKEY